MKKVFTQLLFIVVLLTSISFSALGQSAYGDWYVVGSANMCGSAWNPMDPNNLMSVDKDGFYTKTYFLEPDYYEFKIVQGAWEDEFNYNDVITTCTNIEYTRPEFDESDPTRTNICFTLTESSIVTITLDISEGICLRQMLTTLDVNIGQSWIFSTYTNNFDPIDLGGTALVRGMDTWNGKIYFPLRGVVGKHKILIYDGESGEKMRSLALQKDIFTKIENGDTINAVTLPNNDLHFDSVGNCLIGGCVISTDEDMQSMLIYKVNLETGGCDEIINEPIMDNVRFDAFDVYGDVNNDAVIMAIDNNSLYCYRWTINNAIVGKAEKILLPKLYGPSWNKVTNARMHFVNDSIFYVDGWGCYANRYKYKGGNIEYLDNSENTPDVGVDNSNLAGCTEFSLKDKNGKEQYFFISAKTNGDDGGYTYYYDLIQFADENKNFAEATYLCSFPENTSKMNSNTYRTAEVSVEVVDNIANIYIYIGENGYALYRFSIDGQEVANVVKSIIVSIPENVKENNLYIELVNTKTDDHQKYAISDKDTYTFYGLTIDVVYDIYLKTQQGSVVSEIKGVELKNEDVSVAFESCQIPQTVNITVLTPEKEDITSEVQISWFDSKNTFIKRSSSVTGFVAGDSIYYSVSLPYALGVKYQVVDLTSYEVNDSDNDIVLSLLPLEISRIKGVVKDSLDNELISEAIISVNQTINGKYTKTETYKADKEGVFSVDVIKDYTEITISAGDYIAVKDTIIDFADSIDLGVIKLQRITGAVIDLNFTYTERALADAEPKVTSFYSDYNNVSYVIFNKTQNKAVSEFSVQYPRIVLLEEVSEGDILEITISCKKNSFMPFVVESVVKEDKTVAEINILQLGAIKASYAKTDNSKVVGILYNAEGRFVKKQEYKKETLNITDVVDGDYTLITMGASELFNDVYNIEAFQDLGLTEGVDYVENKIAINSGIISCIDNKSIPSFDESKLYYTDASSNFSINKNSVVVGNYVTLKGMVKFKPEYEGAVNDVNLVVDIPENAIFTENSVIKGYTIIPYTIVNNQIVIPIEAGDNVRFCITPFLKGDYKTTAYVDFEFGGKRVLQPIGSVSFVAENLNINVPSVVSKKEFIISGKAYANTKVQVYDDDLLIGETTTLGNGIWSVTCTLNEPYNLSTHKIYAKTITEQGLELFTEVKECQYDVNAIEVKTVTMINFSHRYGSKYEERTVFDFLNEQKSIPAYWYWPSYPEFTFLIDFTQNDTSKISNVILYVETSTGDQVPINAEYNEKQGKWVATKKFENDGTNIPVNVSLDFDNLNYTLCDSMVFVNALLDDYKKFKLINIDMQGSICSYTINPSSSNLNIHCLSLRTTIDDKIDIYSKIDKSSFVENKIIIDNRCKLYTTNSSAFQFVKETTDSIFLFSSFIYEDSLYFKEYKDLLLGNINVENKKMKKIFYYEPGSDCISPSTDKLNQWRDMIIEDAINMANKKLKCADEVTNIELHSAVKNLRQAVGFSLGSFLAYSWNLTRTASGKPENTIDGLLQLKDVGESAASFGDGMQELTEYGHEQLAIIMNAPNCSDENDDDKKKKGGEHKPKGPGVEGIHDPSGFVYEGVPSNRLEGVMASCYYKEEVEDMYGDKQENIVLWDAENYAQENPLFTDKNGMYRWDVPQGLWQVKFEKEGYQTTYSEWLPVPPPQLEVNVEMVQNVHPEVANVRAYESGIEIDFSKYMTIQSINVDNIVVSQNGENVAGTLTLLNKEQAYLDSTITYVSKVRFNPLTDFSTDDKVTLKVSKKVESYVGMQMESDYIQSFDVVKEVKSIEVDSLVILSYDSSKEVEVEILPAEAAEGKNLIIQSVSPTISTISRDTVKIDADGKISVTIFGELPGNAAFNFAVEGTNISATTLVKVVDKVEEPYSSVASGTAVYYGTKVSLYCSTEDVTIYYTLDGSCPCGDNALVYDEPIVIDNAMTIKAFAVSADGIESEIVEFEYTLKPYVVTLTAENGVVLGGGEYDYGTEITITAVANAGYEFVKWSDDNTDNPRKLVVTQNITLAAEFMFKEEQTNIESVEDDKCVVYYENGVICVNNGGKEYYVYDAVGKLVYSGTKNSIVLPRGVYMIAVGGEVEKVVI